MFNCIFDIFKTTTTRFTDFNFSINRTLNEQ